MKNTLIRYVAGVAGALLAAVLIAPVAHAADFAVDEEIAHALRAEPGGHATGAHTAYWPELGMTMTSSQAPVAFAVGNCATGSVCAYDGYWQTGAKLSWSGCSTYSTSALSSVRSIANARSSGSADALDYGTVVATAWWGGSANVYSWATHVRCNP